MSQRERLIDEARAARIGETDFFALVPRLCDALEEAERERRQILEVLRQLSYAAPSGDEFRLLCVGIGGTNVSEDLHERADRVTAAGQAARELLAAQDSEAAREIEKEAMP